MLRHRNRCHIPRRQQPRAFTLVEILIVVVILGIIATIVIGVFSNTAGDARAKALMDDLRNMRSQIQMYNAEHGDFPSLAAFEQQMVLYSDQAGNTSNTKSDVFRFGPYILSMPRQPVGVEVGKFGVTGMGGYTAGFGWAYDQLSGEFRANLPDSDVDGENKKFNTY